jgi:hypothetical protein
MNTVLPVKQSGITFGGFVFGAFLLVIVSIFGLKLVPAYMEDAKIRNLFNAISHDPDMQKASVSEIRKSFDRRASIDNIKAISADDIEVTSDNGRPFLSASYTIKAPLAGNVSLLIEFKPTSAE